jgi:mannose-6-phosphate isomerase-like protein (cupin superfamily)
MTEPRIIPPGGGSVAAIRNFATATKVSAEDTGGQYSVLEHTLAPGFVAMPMHRHLRESKTFYVLAGGISVKLRERVFAAKAGTTLFIPAGTQHTMWNARPEDPKERGGRGPGETARFLAVVAPGGLERYYEKVASFIREGGKPDVPSILAASAEHGVEIDMLSLLDIIERHKVELA